MTEAKLTMNECSTLPQPERWRKVKINALLVAVSLVWGTTFLIVQESIRLTGPFTFLTLRFGIGALVLAILFHKRLMQITRAEIMTGSIIGLFLFATYALQTLGLQYTTSSKSGFITGMYIPLVAILSALLLRQKLTAISILGVVLSVGGMGLISINGSLQFAFGLGELLTLGCSVAAALHIVCISKFAPRVDAMNLALVQTAFTAIFSLISMPIAGEPFVLPPLAVWGSALFLGVAATAFALAVMNKAQQVVSSVQATLIYALEPVWAGIFGSLAGEQLGLFGWMGCGCIFLGMIIGELRQVWTKKVRNMDSSNELVSAREEETTLR